MTVSVRRISVGTMLLFSFAYGWSRKKTTSMPITSLRHTAAGQVTEAGPVRTVGGIAGTRRAGGAPPWQAFIDAPPAGDWEIHFQDTPIVRKLFGDGGIQDLVVVFSLSGTTPPRT
jgi:hypothetical protein